MNWREFLIFDDRASSPSHLVQGTWVPADHVISLIVEGWTWSDILRSHPELTEDDIRACLAYDIEAETGEATT
jgi:uncharacterized protein (DUF433 family)